VYIVDKVIETVKRTIQQYNMLNPGDGVVVGVSGGPDSVCLLHVLNSLKDEYSIHIYGVHINHQLRGEAADKDEQYARKLCSRLGIPFYSRKIDIRRISEERGISEELAGREERYKLFFEIAGQVGAAKIATAHNLNDQAETILMRFIRGVGPDGLSGIPPVRNDGVIRPLLEVSRELIEEYCYLYHLNPRIDATNLETVYTRNKIRMQLLPDILRYNPNFVAAMAKTANMFREENDFIEIYVDNIRKQYIKVLPQGVSIALDVLMEQHIAIRRRVIRKAIELVKKNLIDIEYKHIDEIMQMLLKGSTGMAVDLPGNVKAEIEYGFLLISQKTAIKADQYSYPLKIGDTVYIKELDSYFTAYITDINQLNKIKLGRYVKAFDYNAVKEEIYIRNRLIGDRFQPFGMKGTKKLKDFFIDEKVPRHLRDKVPLIVSGNDIMWVVGYRTSEKYKYSDKTDKILIIKVAGGLINDK